MQPLLTQLLNLPGIEVEDYTDCGGQLILEVEARIMQATCPRCEQTSHHLHQNHWYFALVFKHQWTNCIFEGESSPVQVSDLRQTMSVRLSISLAIVENRLTDLPSR